MLKEALKEPFTTIENLLNVNKGDQKVLLKNYQHIAHLFVDQFIINSTLMLLHILKQVNVRHFIIYIVEAIVIRHLFYRRFFTDYENGTISYFMIFVIIYRKCFILV